VHLLIFIIVEVGVFLCGYIFGAGAFNILKLNALNAHFCVF